MTTFKWNDILNKNRIKEYRSAKKNFDGRDEFENDYDRFFLVHPLEGFKIRLKFSS